MKVLFFQFLYYFSIICDDNIIIFLYLEEKDEKKGLPYFILFIGIKFSLYLIER